jgi:hypothetical protein
MGRASYTKDKHAYQIKNTFVELVPDDSDFSRNQRAVSDAGAHAASRPGESPSTNFIPQTPSPFLHSQPDPVFMPYPMLDQSQLGGGSVMPALAFGDFGPEDACNSGYNCGEAAGQYAMQYDPNTGQYMTYEYYVPYDASCQYMVDQSQMQDNGPSDEHTQVLLAQLSEKLGEDHIQVSSETPLDSSGGVPMNGSGEDLANSQEMDSWQNGDYYEGSSWGNGNMGMAGGNYGEDQSMGSQMQSSSRQRRAERREAREAARRQQNAATAISADCVSEESKNAAHWASDQPTGAITTVMFRNIPNKYTREMLVNQLEQDMRGQFDFIYLPIYFKNKCNVGYAFINFRTVEACDTFVNRFNGVEVRRCLPGLNSRKVTEVTPARVQGFEENVQRLRNSPVMRELVHKPEWMPLIFEHDGEQVPFPSPERPLDPIKPRRRARDEEARLL